MATGPTPATPTSRSSRRWTCPPPRGEGIEPEGRARGDVLPELVEPELDRGEDAERQRPQVERSEPAGPAAPQQQRDQHGDTAATERERPQLHLGDVGGVEHAQPHVVVEGVDLVDVPGHLVAVGDRRQPAGVLGGEQPGLPDRQQPARSDEQGGDEAEGDEGATAPSAASPSRGDPTSGPVGPVDRVVVIEVPRSTVGRGRGGRTRHSTVNVPSMPADRCPGIEQ
jgi:hypothetical protein